MTDVSACLSDNLPTGREGILQLPQDRQIGYAENGNPASRTVVLFFGGYWSVGSAPHLTGPLDRLDIHYIAPTIPGNGESSAIVGRPYNLGLYRDITALLEHFHKVEDVDNIFVAGGSYGTVQAQIIYGAPYDLFPVGPKIRGMLLLAPFSPFRYHTSYHKSMTWQNWLSFGPPSQIVPFRIIQRLIASAMRSKLKNLDAIKKFMYDFAVKPMDKDEQAKMVEWLKTRNLTEDEWLTNMSKGILRSLANWDGFMEGSDVLHSDWGFDPKQLDVEHSKAPILIVGSDKDDLGKEMYHWIQQNYANSTIREVHGGHIASLFYIDELWEQLLQLSQMA